MMILAFFVMYFTQYSFSKQTCIKQYQDSKRIPLLFLISWILLSNNP